MNLIKKKVTFKSILKQKNGDEFDECLHTVPYNTKFRIEKSTKQEYSKRKNIENKLKEGILSSLEEDSKENTNFEIGFRYYPKKSKKKKNWILS